MKRLFVTLVCLLLASMAGPLSAQSLVWSPTDYLPIPRRNHASCYNEGKVYVAGGYNSLIQKKSSVFAYDTLTNTWSSVASMGISRSNFGLVAHNGYLYAIGGDPFLSSMERYEPDSNQWVQMPPLPTGRQHLGCAVVGNRIYAIGGLDAMNSYSKKNEYFDIDSNAWYEAEPIPVNRELFGIASCNGKIYVFGGTNGVSLYNTTYCYDPVNDSWTTVTAMPTGRYGQAAAVTGNKIYVLGGGGISGNALSSVDVYNTITDQWDTATSMLTPRKLVAACTANGRIYVNGGCDDAFSPYNTSEKGWISQIGIDNKKNEIENLVFKNYGGLSQLEFTLSTASRLTVELYDMQGRRVSGIEAERFTAGRNQVDIGTGFERGIYLVVIWSGDGVFSRKVFVGG